MLALRSDSVSCNQVSEYDAGQGVAVSGLLCKDYSIGVGDGSAAAPSFAFESDATTGLYFVGSHTLGVSTNGVQKLRIAPAAMVFTADLTTTTFSSAQESVNAGIGAIVVTGGVAVQKNVYIGGSLTVGGTITRTGFLLANGAAVSPSYSFSSDTNTGMYLIATGQLGFSVGGTLQMTLTSSMLFFAASCATTTFAATTTSSSTTTGALVAKGGLGIAGDLTVSGSFNVASSQSYTQYAHHAGGGFVNSADTTTGLSIDYAGEGIVMKSAGQYTMKLKSNSVAIGYQAIAGTESVSIGRNTATNNYSVSLGSGATAFGTNAVCVCGSASSVDYNIRIGSGAQNANTLPITIG